MLFRYMREDGPIDITNTSGNSTRLGAEWKELHKALHGTAESIGGVEFKDVQDPEQLKVNEAITAKIYEALKDEETRSKVLTKSGRVSIVALRDEIGVNPPKHLVDKQWNRVKEELAL